MKKTPYLIHDPSTSAAAQAVYLPGIAASVDEAAAVHRDINLPGVFELSTLTDEKMRRYASEMDLNNLTFSRTGWLYMTFEVDRHHPLALKHYCTSPTEEQGVPPQEQPVRILVARNMREVRLDKTIDRIKWAVGYKLPPEPAGSPQGRRLVLSTGIDYHEIQQWLSHCRRHHASCGHAALEGAAFPGLLVIDCHTFRVVALPSGCSYVALSYVWGKVGQQDPGVFHRDLGDFDLPRTVRDAIVVACRLGRRYLWVDRYCIDGSDGRRKQHVISNMDSIYRGAEVTIIAAAGDDAGHGLPGVSETLRQPKQTRAAAGTDPEVYLPLPISEISASAWATRGWTFQEGYLSRCRLVFTDSQSYYQCLNQQFLEAEPVPSPGAASRADDDPFGRFFPRGGVGTARDFFLRVNDYAPRNLTFADDSLAAFLGICRSYQRTSDPVAHLFGLPVFLDSAYGLRGGIAASLLWQRRMPGLPDGAAGGARERVNTLPSWTWAAWTGWGGGGDSGFPDAPYSHYPHGLKNPPGNTPPAEWGYARELDTDVDAEVEHGSELIDVLEYALLQTQKASSYEEIVVLPCLYLTCWIANVAFVSDPEETDRLTYPLGELFLDAKADHVLRHRILTERWDVAIIAWGTSPGHRAGVLLLDYLGLGVYSRLGVFRPPWTWRKGALHQTGPNEGYLNQETFPVYRTRIKLL